MSLEDGTLSSRSKTRPKRVCSSSVRSPSRLLVAVTGQPIITDQRVPIVPKIESVGIVPTSDVGGLPTIGAVGILVRFSAVYTPYRRCAYG